MTLKPLLTNYAYFHYNSLFNNYIIIKKYNVIYFEEIHNLDIYI